MTHSPVINSSSSNNNFLFATILEKIVPHVSISKKNKFELISTRHSDYDFIDDFFVNDFLQKKNKFDVLISHCNNQFLTLEKRQKTLIYFSKAQKCIWAFKKLANIFYLKKKIKKSDIENDLTLNPLSQYPDSLKINLLQEDTNYTFFINDLIKIINLSLSYAPEVFSEPYEPKNPYINVPFTKANLYNIYFFIKNSQRMMPILFHYFFLCNFNLAKFTVEYEADIREIVLKSYYKDASESKKYNDIITMLRKYKSSCISLQIHPDFDKAIVIFTFEHLLYHYLIHQYSYQPSKRLLSKRIINKYLYSFTKNNPSFGRISIFDSSTSLSNEPSTSQGMIDFISNLNSLGITSTSSRYSYNANLLDSRLEDSDSVYDLLEELVNLSRVTRRRRFRAQRPPPRDLSNNTLANMISTGGDSLQSSTISSNSIISRIEGGVVTSSETEGIVELSTSEDEDESYTRDSINISNNEDSETNENTNSNENTETNENLLSVVGRSVIPNLTSPARIEYSSHIVTTFPNNLRSPINIVESTVNSVIDSAIQSAIITNPSNSVVRLHSRRDAMIPSTSLNSNLQNLVLNNSNLPILDISNNLHDGEIELPEEENDEIETPNSNDLNPFETTYPEGFNPNFEET